MENFSVEFFVPHLPKLPNDHGNFGRSRFYEKMKWQKLISHKYAMLRPNQPLNKSRLSFTRLSTRRPDQDNLMASLKPVIDSLKYSGFIVDDSPDHVLIDALWEKAPRKQSGLLIRVVECR